MRHAFDIALKDLRRIYRDVPALVMMLAAPLVIALVLGAAFGGSGDFSIRPIKTVVADLDTGAGAAPTGEGAATGDSDAVGGSAGESSATGESPGLAQILGDQSLAFLIDLTTVATEAEARAAVDDGTAVVAVIQPKGLAAAAAAPQTEGASFVVYRDPTSSLGPGIVTGFVRQYADGLNSARAAAAGAVELGLASGRLAPEQAAAVAAAAAVGFAARTSAGIPGPGVQARAPQVSGGEAARDVGVTGPVLAGMMIFFMLMTGSNQARTILNEQREGTLQRLFTTPTPRGVVLAGKFLSVFLVVLVQAVILLAAGRVLMGIHWGGIAPIVGLTVAGVAVSAGLGVFLLSLARTEAQATAFGTGVLLVLALPGGNFIGTADLGGWYHTVRRLTPNGWLLIGWDSTLRGGGLTDVIIPIAVCLAIALLTFVAGALIFRRRIL